MIKIQTKRASKIKSIVDVKINVRINWNIKIGKIARSNIQMHLFNQEGSLYRYIKNTSLILLYV